MLCGRYDLELSSTARYVTIRVHQTLQIEIWLWHKLLGEVTNVNPGYLVTIMHGLILRGKLYLGIGDHGL